VFDGFTFWFAIAEEAEMTNPSGHECRRSGSAFSIIAVVAAFAGFTILTAANPARVRAQTQSQSEETSNRPLPSFEVASIKLDRSESGHLSIGFRPGRFTTIWATAKSLIEYAYSLESDARLLRGPSWINSDKYDIEAKMDDSLADNLQKLPVRNRAEQVRLMVQSLLADRFKLKVSHATKELPIYALVVAKGGAKLMPAANAGGKDSNHMESSVNGTTGDLVATDASINSFLGVLARQPELERRGVADQTGLKGRYDFKLHWTREYLVPRENDTSGDEALANAPSPSSQGPSLFTALREQLGLKLEAGKGPVNVIIIDHIERPSEN
jgi:uncharacterized protein (TIGR03435 family)